MFGKKLNSTASATSLSTEIDTITKTFTTMVENLRQKASTALQLKAEKENRISELQQECADLQAVNDRAAGMAELMLVRIVAEIITEVSVFPEDVVNADTIGDYKAELDCNVNNAALDYLARHLSGSDDIRIIATEPFDVGVEEYGNTLNAWQKEYNKRMKKYEKTLE